MMRICSLLVVLLFQYISMASAEADVQQIHRFGLFVGANEGQQGLQHLRWAVRDAQKMASIMTETGGIERADEVVLNQPSGTELLRKVHQMQVAIRAEKAKGQRVEFYFYYSGHSDEQGLLLGGDHVLYSDLRKAITSTDADVNVAILDSCDSGAFTRTKGGKRVMPFLSDLSSQTTGYAFLTSSSDTEYSQESDQLKGSFFTYYLITGLRGAADTTGDKKVTLNQAYQYAFQETLARTEGTDSGAQHPSYDFQLKGSGDLVMSDLSNPQSSFLLDQKLGGRLFIRDQKDALVCELQKEAGKALTIAVPSGNYTIRYQKDGFLYSATLTVLRGRQLVVSNENFVSQVAQENRLRGDGDEQAPRRLNFFDLEAIPSFQIPADVNTAFSIGVLGARVMAIRGLQVSSLFSLADESLNGLQIGGISANAGAVEGSQVAGIFTTASDLCGLQTAGILAKAKNVTGLQVGGIFSIADDLKGMQVAGVFGLSKNVTGLQTSGVYEQASQVTGLQVAGILNVAQSVDGAQAGVINITTGKVHGVQIGVFNYADDMDGIPIGLVSWVTHGIHEVSFGYKSSTNGPFVRWTGGSRMFWSSLEVGVQNIFEGGETPRGLWLDTSMGFRLKLQPVSFDIGAGLESILTDGSDNQAQIAWMHFSGHSQLVPHFDVTARYDVAKQVSVWAGPSLDLTDSRIMNLSEYAANQTNFHLFDFSPGVSEVYVGFSAGLTIKL